MRKATTSYLSFRCPATLEILNDAKSLYKDLANTLKLEEWKERVGSASNSKDLWRIFNSLQGKRPAIPTPLDPRERVESLAREIAARADPEALPEPTKRILANLRPGRIEEVAQAIGTPHDATDIPFSMTELRYAISKASCNSAPGLDSVHVSLLQKGPESLMFAILSLCNRSWILGQLPEDWKHAVEIMIPKSTPDSFRPIALLSTVSKTMERMVAVRLQKILPPPPRNSHGFVQGRSTADALSQVIDFISSRRSAVGVFIDLEKAFELAQHDTILATLAGLGVRGNLLAWLRNYLTGRSGQVSFLGRMSRRHDLRCGVPQGSVLGPALNCWTHFSWGLAACN